MTISKFIAATVLTTAVTMPVHATDGNLLMHLCRPDADEFGQGVCTGYISGAWEMFAVTFNKETDRCVKDGITHQQVKEAVMDYLSGATAADLALPAYVLIPNAITTAYPCDTSNDAPVSKEKEQ